MVALAERQQGHGGGVAGAVRGRVGLTADHVAQRVDAEGALLDDHAAEEASDEEAGQGAPSEVTGVPLDDAVPTIRKTPFFQASHAARYQRQALIRQIEAASNRTLVCYVSGNACAIERDDTLPMVDLLHNIEVGSDIDLLLHTGGGDIDAAEKLISMVRQRVGTGTLRAIVPDYAKSAGTLMVLGTDVVLMSDTSELGPIDPQIVLADAPVHVTPTGSLEPRMVTPV